MGIPAPREKKKGNSLLKNTLRLLPRVNPSGIMLRASLLQSKVLKHACAHGMSWSKIGGNCIRQFGSEREEIKEELIERLLKAKDDAGVTFDEIAKKLKVTNVYTAQLFMNQAQLKAKTAEKLKAIVPGISEEDLKLMQKCPMRSFDPAIMQEPFVYRLVEAMQHYGLGLKHLVNEKKGDGIISAIDLYMNMDVIKGSQGEDRFVITLNGKFLPHIEQLASNNTAATGQKPDTEGATTKRTRTKKEKEEVPLVAATEVVTP